MATNLMRSAAAHDPFKFSKDELEATRANSVWFEQERRPEELRRGGYRNVLLSDGSMNLTGRDGDFGSLR